MPFNPQVDDVLVIKNARYRVTEHPAAPGIPYGQAGRRAIVYQVIAEEEKRALKVFSRRFRTPRLALAGQNLAPHASFPGLQVCQRTVLVPKRNRDLLQKHPDLAYAMLMPWIQGPTWMEVMIHGRSLGRTRSLELAWSLAKVVSRMEEDGLAHCDLSGANVMLSPEGNVVLVDVEEMYGAELEEPEALPCGTPGYGHRTRSDGFWGPAADRFAGAVLLSEMLGWCDERVREAAWGEQYFAEQEMQAESERYHLLTKVLEEQWSTRVAELLEQAWGSESLEDCPKFGKWSDALSQFTSETASSATAHDAEESSGAETDKARSLVDRARRLEAEGQLGTALEIYRQAQEVAPRETSLAEELGFIIDDLEERLRQEAELARLFDRGLEAHREGDWARVKELLSDVGEKRPDYERDGRSIKSLLEEVEKQSTESRQGVPGWVWVSLAFALIVGGAFWFKDSLHGGSGVPPVATSTLRPTAMDTESAPTSEVAERQARMLRETPSRYEILVASETGTFVIESQTAEVINQLSSRRTRSAEPMPNGHILVVDDAIREVNRDGGTVREMPLPRALTTHALPLDDGTMWVFSADDGTEDSETFVERIDWSGDVMVSEPGFHYPFEARLRENGNLLIVDGTSALTEMSPDGEVAAVFSISDWAASVCPVDGTILYGRHDGVGLLGRGGEEVWFHKGGRVISVDSLPGGGALLAKRLSGVISEITPGGREVWSADFSAPWSVRYLAPRDPDARTQTPVPTKHPTETSSSSGSAPPPPQTCPLSPEVVVFAAGPSDQKSVRIRWTPMSEASHYWPRVAGENPAGECCQTLILDGSVSTEDTEYTIDWWTIDQNTYSFGERFVGAISAMTGNDRRICTSRRFEFYR